MRLFLILTFLTFALGGCASLENPKEGQTITGTGTVRFVELEGEGFYGIESDDGHQYQPNVLSTRFRKEGIRVTFRIKVSKIEPKASMWGISVDVLAIDERKGDDKLIETIGTIKYIDLEGGFYGIIGKDNKDYHPVEKLEPRFRKNNLTVRFKARIREQGMGIQMWGTPIDVLEIKVYK